MSMARLRSNIGQLAQVAASRYQPAGEGEVTSYDPDSFAVKVMLQPQGIETGWLPIRVLQSGNGFGVYAAPNIGDLASVEFLEGDTNVGRCTGFVPNDVDKPPPVQAGEIWIKHQDGALVKFLPGGVMRMEAPGGFEMIGDADLTGNLSVSGTVKAGGDITDNSPSNTVTVKQLRDAYNAAKYPVIAVGSPTGTTDHPAT